MIHLTSGAEDRAERYRVLIIDDSLVARSILTQVLGTSPDLEVVAAVAETAEATAILSTTQVDAVTLDLEMPGTGGLRYLPALRQLNIPTLCLSNSIGEDADLVGLLLLVGASACLNKVAALAAPDHLKRTVKKVAARQLPLTAAQRKAMKRAMDKRAEDAAEYGIRDDWQLMRQ